MFDFLSIVWNVDPVIFSIGNKAIRFYSLLFVSGFPLGYYLFTRFYKREKVNVSLIDPLLYISLIGTLVGARLGHCLFYQPDYYLSHPIEILKVWEGGLASHGGAIALVLCIFIYAHKYGRKNGFDAMWTFDRLAIAVCFAGCLIRVGNLFNSEIFGGPTNLPWGFMFPRSYEWVTNYGPDAFPPSGTACHPTQIYEALSYLILGIILLWVYNKKADKIHKGWVFGVFLIVLFGMRFLIEFIKNDQVSFEAEMKLNMGQLLSVPFIIAGVAILVLSYVYKKPFLREDMSDGSQSQNNNKRKATLPKDQRMSAAKRKAMAAKN